MTRYAKKDKTEHEASSWKDLSKGKSSIQQSHSKSGDRKMGENKDYRNIKKFRRKDHTNDFRKGSNIGKDCRSSSSVWIDRKALREEIDQKHTKQKSSACYVCRKEGHKASNCPNKVGASNICFKCGSTEHFIGNCKVSLPKGEFPFATCYICKERGHVSNRCPDNPRGLYPDGGGCKICGSVEHLRSACPERNGKTEFAKEGPQRKFLVIKANDKQSVDAIVSDSSDSDSDAPVIVKRPRVVKF